MVQKQSGNWPVSSRLLSSGFWEDNTSLLVGTWGDLQCLAHKEILKTWLLKIAGDYQRLLELLRCELPFFSAVTVEISSPNCAASSFCLKIVMPQNSHTVYRNRLYTSNKDPTPWQLQVTFPSMSVTGAQLLKQDCFSPLNPEIPTGLSHIIPPC